MKKLLVMILCVMLFFGCAVLVSAEETYNNAGELYEAWAENLPDFICGVWSTDGGVVNLTFGIQNSEAGNAGKQRMLDLIEDDSTITFVYQKYSRNDLLRIQQEIDKYMQLDLGLISTGVYDTRNCVALGILEERKDDAKTKAMIREITDKYGDAVAVEYTGEIVPTELTEQTVRTAEVVPIALVVVVLTFTVLLAVQKRGFLLQTGNGATVVSAAAPTEKALKAMIQTAGYQTSSDLDQRIMNAICEQE